MARAPRTPRETRSRAFDPRLVVGLLLVVGSIAGVYAVVSAADETVDVYVAPAALMPGDRVRPSQLDVRSVRLDDAVNLYLVPGDIPATGLVVTRTVVAGELVPQSAVGSAEGLRVTSIVLSLDGGLAASIAPGSLVDVWAAREGENGVEPPVVLVSGATVVRLVQSPSIIAGGDVTAVEVLIERTRIARVLEATANGDTLSIVPATIPSER